MIRVARRALFEPAEKTDCMFGTLKMLSGVQEELKSFESQSLSARGYRSALPLFSSHKPILLMEVSNLKTWLAQTNTARPGCHVFGATLASL